MVDMSCQVPGGRRIWLGAGSGAARTPEVIEYLAWSKSRIERDDPPVLLTPMYAKGAHAMQRLMTRTFKQRKTIHWLKASYARRRDLVLEPGIYIELIILS